MLPKVDHSENTLVKIDARIRQIVWTSGMFLIVFLILQQNLQEGKRVEILSAK